MINDILKPKSNKEVYETIDRMVNYMPSLIEFLKDYELTHERNVKSFDYVSKLIGESMLNLYIIDSQHDFYRALYRHLLHWNQNKIVERVQFMSKTPFSHVLVYKGLAARIMGEHQVKLLISKEAIFSLLSPNLDSLV